MDIQHACDRLLDRCGCRYNLGLGNMAMKISREQLCELDAWDLRICVRHLATETPPRFLRAVMGDLLVAYTELGELIANMRTFNENRSLDGGIIRDD